MTIGNVRLILTASHQAIAGSDFEAGLTIIDNPAAIMAVMDRAVNGPIICIENIIKIYHSTAKFVCWIRNPKK